MLTIAYTILRAWFFFRATREIREERACTILRKRVWLRRSGTSVQVVLADLLLQATWDELVRRGACRRLA